MRLFNENDAPYGYEDVNLDMYNQITIEIDKLFDYLIDLVQKAKEWRPNNFKGWMGHLFGKQSPNPYFEEQFRSFGSLDVYQECSKIIKNFTQVLNENSTASLDNKLIPALQNARNAIKQKIKNIIFNPRTTKPTNWTDPEQKEKLNKWVKAWKAAREKLIANQSAQNKATATPAYVNNQPLTSDEESEIINAMAAQNQSDIGSVPSSASRSHSNAFGNLSRSTPDKSSANTPSVSPSTPSVSPSTPSVSPSTPSVSPSTPSVSPSTPSVSPSTPLPRQSQSKTTVPEIEPLDIPDNENFKIDNLNRDEATYYAIGNLANQIVNNIPIQKHALKDLHEDESNLVYNIDDIDSQYIQKMVSTNFFSYYDALPDDEDDLKKGTSLIALGKKILGPKINSGQAEEIRKQKGRKKIPLDQVSENKQNAIRKNLKIIFDQLYLKPEDRNSLEGRDAIKKIVNTYDKQTFTVNDIENAIKNYMLKEKIPNEFYDKFIKLFAVLENRKTAIGKRSINNTLMQFYEDILHSPVISNNIGESIIYYKNLLKNNIKLNENKIIFKEFCKFNTAKEKISFLKNKLKN